MASSYPITVTVLVDLGSSPAYPVAGTPFTLDNATYGRLDYNFLSSGTSYIVDVSSQVQKIQIGGGYNLLQDQFEANQGTVRIYDPNGWWNPQNTASPYYGFLSPNKKIVIQATYLGTTYTQFSGYINAYNYTFPTNMNFGYVDLAVCDAFRLFNIAEITTVAGTSNGQTTGARITNILDSLNFPTSLRSVDTGDQLVQNDPGTTRIALSAMKNVEFVEQGAFYVDANGYAVFKSRSNIVKTNGAAPITYFSNDGTGIAYSNIKFAHDDKLIVNSAVFTNIGGTAQTYTDSGSVTKYFLHTVSNKNLVGYNNAQALANATLYVNTRKDTTIRIDSISQDLTTPNYDAGIVAALTLDYFSTVNIKNVQSNGSTVTKTLQIMGSNYTITPTNYDITFTTSEPIVDGFILDSALYGILDTSILT